MIKSEMSCDGGKYQFSSRKSNHQKRQSSSSGYHHILTHEEVLCHIKSSRRHLIESHPHPNSEDSVTFWGTDQKMMTSLMMMSQIFLVTLIKCFISGITSVSITASSSSSSFMMVLIANCHLMGQHALVEASSVPSSQNLWNYQMTVDPSPIVASFSTSNASINFTHLAVDPISGRVYVGVTNWIYQLNSNLFLEHSVRTGPVEDSPHCSPSDCLGVDPYHIRPTKNVNKVLVIDPSSRMLISCGSVHQGSCRRHSLSDVRQAEPLIGVPVAANDENSSTIAFVGTANYYGAHSVSNVLYVGASNSRLGPYRDVVPAISTRSLESGSRLFSVIEKSFTDSARVDISHHLRDYFIVKYIHGFQSNDFVYFATVQKKSHFRALEEWGYVTRLSRVCSSDAGYHTYTEVTLECLGQDGTDYTLLQDASVIRAGQSLAHAYRIEEDSEVLVGVFASSKENGPNPDSPSAVCVYPVEQIEKSFIENIHLCYNGSVMIRNMDYIAGNIQDCPRAGKSGNVMNFCSENLKINGSIPITGYSVINYNDVTLTSVLPLNTGRQTVVFLGTSNGHLKKIDFRKGQEAHESYDISVDEGHPILPDMFVDRNRKHIFLSSPYKVIKVLVNIHDLIHHPHEPNNSNQRGSSSLLPDDPVVTTIINNPILFEEKDPNSVYNLNPDDLMESDVKSAIDTSSPQSAQQPSSPPTNDDPVIPEVRTGGGGAGETGLSSSTSASSKEQDITSIIICAMCIAVIGTLTILAAVTFYKRNRLNALRKQYSSSSTSQFQKHDPSKVPPPLISSNQSIMKPLPLLPLTSNPDLSSNLTPETQVNAIYSEIDEMPSSSSCSINDNPLINQLSLNKIDNLNYNHQFSQDHHHHVSSSPHQLQSVMAGSRMPVSYPQFFTFNTIGRTRNKSNPYIYTPDSMGPTRIPGVAIPCSPILTSGGGGVATPANTYAVYSCKKIRTSRDKPSYTSSDRFV